MSSSNDYIIIEEGKNTSDDAEDSDVALVHREADQASLDALEKQGVFLTQEEANNIDPAEPRDEFSRELQQLSGIEIIADEETEPSL